ncbi:MAG: RNA polymerase sigma factor [Acidobacteria bacterium]|nr:RNA polymerase sigma factor [Acidobacteriota bacterium]MCW5969839.1 RNA polymerase sigma factor [Blastocatellales bacterium]
MRADGARAAMMMLGKPAAASDEDLLRRMLDGDGEAFEALYDRRQPSVYRFALRMSGSPAFAEDIAQEVFLALIREGVTFDPSRGSVAAYLFGMTRHRVLRRLERERRMSSLTGEDTEDEGFVPNGPVASDDPLEDAVRSERVEWVRRAVLALPVHYREVVVLCSLHDLSYETAAEILGCPVGTVRSRLNRARAMLADKLRALGGDRATAAG